MDESIFVGMDSQEVYEYLGEMLQGVVYVMDSANTVAIVERILDSDVGDILNALNNPTDLYDMITRTKQSMGL